MKGVLKASRIVIFVAALSGCSHVQKAWMASWGNPFPEGEESKALGERVYVKDCASCHGLSGRGDGPDSAQLKAPLPNFTDGSYHKSLGLVAANIAYGKRQEMPPFRSLLSEKEIWAVADYVRRLSASARQ